MRRVLILLLAAAVLLSACMPPGMEQGGVAQAAPDLSVETSAEATPPVEAPTPLATRQAFLPGTLVDYEAQAGDTLAALAVRFNTSVAEIRAANPIIPDDATTMPPGMPMQIPIYYQPLWGTSYRILPDSLFVNGPEQVGFDAGEFVRQQPGWLKDYRGTVGEQTRRGGDLVTYIADQFSVSPRLLLAMIEYQAGGLTQEEPLRDPYGYTFGQVKGMYRGLTNQLLWAANQLNDAYYAHRLGMVSEIQRPDGRVEIPDPWQNAGTVALQRFFARLSPADEYDLAISGEGLAKTYAELFGDPWLEVKPHIPGSLRQPDLSLPFQPGYTWAYTGGPHTGWGDSLPYAAIDFAPPAVVGGCAPASEPSTAVADGILARKGIAEAYLDLDGDGDIRTGWVIFYLHLSTATIPPQGTLLQRGDPIGMPSCEGGRATGTHVHIARLYNGEWIPAGSGILPFTMEGWQVADGAGPYSGYLLRFSERVIANTASDGSSHIRSNPQP